MLMGLMLRRSALASILARNRSGFGSQVASTLGGLVVNLYTFNPGLESCRLGNLAGDEVWTLD